MKLKSEKYKGRIIHFDKQKLNPTSEEVIVAAYWSESDGEPRGIGDCFTKYEAFEKSKEIIDYQSTVKLKPLTCGHCGRPTYDGEEIEGEFVCPECAEEWREGGGTW